MKRIVGIITSLCMLISCFQGIVLASDQNTFTDVTGKEYYAYAAKVLAKLEILKGYEDGSFGADKDITRAEMAAIICRMLGKEADANKAQGKTDFDDVSSSHWATGYINYASDNGIIEGDGDGKFRPEDNVKYEEAIKMVVCAVGLGDNVMVDPQDWSKEYLEIASNNGITDDVKGSKGKSSSRGDVAVMVYNGLTYDLVAPVASLESGRYTGTKSVTLTTSTKDATIYYTTDGTTPTVNSTKYTKAVSVSKTQTLKAIAVVYDMLVSDVMSVDYTIKTSSGGGGSSTTKYTVSFDLNYDGATGVPASQSVKKGNMASCPESPRREDYFFAGWYTNKDYTESFDFENTVIDKNYTLIARWVNIVEETDTDSDGLTDAFEEYYGTDINNPDTDGDGLTDYFEVIILGTDPCMVDTDNNGISDADEDFDEDGLNNLSEQEYGCQPFLPDSDMDGLEDYDEIIYYGTDAANDDTDGDGVSDGKEIELGTDPLTVEESFEVSVTSDIEDTVSPSVCVTLSGEQVETLSISAVDDDFLFPEDMPGYMGKCYNFSVEGEFEQAEISFEFDASDLGPDAEPTIYYFNEELQLLEEIETTVVGNTASARVTHFSKYILVDRREYEDSIMWQDAWENDDTYTSAEVVLVIDDSGSMSWNDPSNERLSVAANLINGLPEGSKMGIVQFTSYYSVLAPITDDKNAALSALNEFYSSGGTSMYSAVQGSLGMFGNDEDVLRAMIVLSDGDTDDDYLHSSVVSTANAESVKIYTVGLGYTSNNLQSLASETGGVFYYATNASGLEEIYNQIGKGIDLSVDKDDDGIPDYYEEHINEIQMFNGKFMSDLYMKEVKLNSDEPDCDGDGLLDGEEIVINYIYNEDHTKMYVVGTMYSHPNMEDSDGDGYKDIEEDRDRRMQWDVSSRDLLMFSELVYKNDGSTNDELKKWKAIAVSTNIFGQEYKSWAGMQAVAYECDDNIVIAYRGTEPASLDFVQDVILADIITFISGMNIQTIPAKNFAKQIMQKYSNDHKIYICGHSLGGYCAYMGASEALQYNSSAVEQFAVFNGFGLADIDIRILNLLDKLDQEIDKLDGDQLLKLQIAIRLIKLTRLTKIKDIEILEANAVKGREYRIEGDIVSALWFTKHFSTGTVTYPHTGEDNIIARHMFDSFYDCDDFKLYERPQSN